MDRRKFFRAIGLGIFGTVVVKVKTELVFETDPNQFTPFCGEQAEFLDIQRKQVFDNPSQNTLIHGISREEIKNLIDGSWKL